MNETSMPTVEYRTVNNIVVVRSHSRRDAVVGHAGYSPIGEHKWSTLYEALEPSHTPGVGLVPTDPSLHQHRYGHRSIRGRGKYAPVTLRVGGTHDALCEEAYEAIVAAFPETRDGARDGGDIRLAGRIEG